MFLATLPAQNPPTPNRLWHGRHRETLSWGPQHVRRLKIHLTNWRLTHGVETFTFVLPRRTTNASISLSMTTTVTSCPHPKVPKNNPKSPKNTAFDLKENLGLFCQASSPRVSTNWSQLVQLSISEALLWPFCCALTWNSARVQLIDPMWIIRARVPLWQTHPANRKTSIDQKRREKIDPRERFLAFSRAHYPLKIELWEHRWR